MDRKVEYFIKKIEESLQDKNYAEAQFYYKKSISAVGIVEEIAPYKIIIEESLQNKNYAESTSSSSEVGNITTSEKEIGEDSSNAGHNSNNVDMQAVNAIKNKIINDKLIAAVVISIGIIAFIIYYIFGIYPENHLRKEFYKTWYQGDVSSNTSGGSYLEFNEQVDETFKIYYRASNHSLIGSFQCKIVDGDEIDVDGNIINVTFKGDTVIFSPSFVDVSEKSVWRSDKDYTTDDQTGNFSNDGAFHTSDSLDNMDNFDESEDESETSNSNTVDNSIVESNDVLNDNTNSSGTVIDNGNGKTNAGTTTQNNSKCASGHSWKELTKTVHHEEVGHYEDKEIANKVNKYKCAVCYSNFNSVNEYYSHFDASHGNTGNSNVFRERYESVEDWDYSYEKQWVVDTEAYDETVVTGYKCSVCGETK